MTIHDITAALAGICLAAKDGAKVIKTDVPKPVVRPAFKVDVMPFGACAACGGARDKSADIDIWYYPQDAQRPRDECAAVCRALADALCEGFAAGGAWLYLDDDISADLSSGVLALQLAVSWTESAAETGEMMDTLVYDGEEIENGSNDAEN